MTSDRSERQRSYRPEEGAVSEAAGASAAESRERREQVMEETQDLLAELDMMMREAVGLDENASDEKFTERAAKMANEFVHKGGQQVATVRPLLTLLLSGAANAAA